jgi:SAM-dependent methyltransferase
MEKELMEKMNNMQEQIDRLEKGLNDRLNRLERNILMEIRAGFFNHKFDLKRQGILPEEPFTCQTIYDDIFYERHRYGSLISAVRVLKKLLPVFKASSMVDFGCGTGTWLYAAKCLGVSEVLGIDGDYVDRSKLMIAQEEFRAADLEQPIVLPGQYDVAISLEVAEHLHESASDSLISSICNSADNIIFSAATPGQGGNNHINEQPHEYWHTKFEERGYLSIDIRNLFAANWEIEGWYRNNIFLYIREAHMVQEAKNAAHGREICIFCMGEIGNRLLPYFKDWFGVRLKYVSDNDPQKWGKAYYGIQCVSPDDLPRGICVFIATLNTEINEEVVKQLNDKGIEAVYPCLIQSAANAKK